LIRKIFRGPSPGPSRKEGSIGRERKSKEEMRNRGISRTISGGTDGFPESCPPIGEKSRALLSPTKQDRVFLWVLTTTVWAEFHSLTPSSFSHSTGNVKQSPSRWRPKPLLRWEPPRMPCDAIFLNLGYLGGRHIIVFGFPVLPKDQALPATIRDSSRIFAVGSKNRSTITNTAGDRSFGAVNGSSNRSFQ